MSPATLYAIKHVPTGKLMPARIFRTNAAGYTHWEPTDTEPGGYGGYNPLLPRFFLDKQSAALAVSYWLKGPHKAYTYTEKESWEMPQEYTVQAGTISEPAKIPRNPGDLILVEFILTPKA